MNRMETIQEFLEEIVNGCGSHQPEFWVDTGTWHPMNEGFEDFSTTDNRHFLWVRHIEQVLDNTSAVAVFAIESESKMPSEFLQQMWDESHKTTCLEMRGYFVKKASLWFRNRGLDLVLIVATINEAWDKRLFVIVN